MKSQDRKQAIQAYRERDPVMGVYEVHCAARGVSWIDISRSLDTQENHLWFALRCGSHRNPALQAAWNDLGQDACTFTAREYLGKDDLAFPEDRLKSMRTSWLARTGGKSL